VNSVATVQYFHWSMHFLTENPAVQDKLLYDALINIIVIICTAVLPVLHFENNALSKLSAILITQLKTYLTIIKKQK
jgi:hypothetical protein